MKKECLILSALISTASAFSQHKAPNIIFILCDDMGYGDLGCYGQKYINTPHIDQMAAEGMRFTQAYAGSPVSAPSRATLMTGQHSGHTHVRGNKEYWPQSAVVTYGENQDYAVVGQEPYDSAHVILPEVMKKNGYTTGMFGKWAGGYEGSWSTPDKRGVDEFYGYICQFQAHLYYPNFLNRYSRSKGDKEVKRIVLEENIKYPMFGDDYFKRPQYSADLIHQEALKWLDAQTGEQPFCGIFTYTLPHAELAHQAFLLKASVCVGCLLVIVLIVILTLHYKKRMAERKIKLLQQENELNAARRYIEGLEEECKYFAKELHDGIANDLLGLQMKIENTTNSDNVQELGTLIKEVRNNVRNISHELMPPEFEHLSLDEILYQYADKLSENTGIQVTYTSGSCNPIPNETAYELYRIVQEITMNIVKHANAHCISVSLYAEHEKQYTLKITDDGTVTTPHKANSRGIGLRTVNDRAKAIDGTIQRESSENNNIFTLQFKVK